MTLRIYPWKSGCVMLMWASLLACAVPAAAQFETAVVLGTVQDSSGATVRAATITLTNAQTGIATSTQTDENRSDRHFQPARFSSRQR